MRKQKQRVILIAHDIRSCHNIGAMLRTAEGLGVNSFIMSGYSPYPEVIDDSRMPHEAEKISKAIRKTALGAENMIAWQHTAHLTKYIKELRKNGFRIFAIEQAPSSIALPDFTPSERLALIVGNEITGLDSSLLATLDGIVEIPMLGKKESYNVSAAAAIVLYHCVFSAGFH